MSKGPTIVATVEYEAPTYAWARAYAQQHKLNLRAVLNAALAEYAARRQQTQAGPEPQLHYRRGHPSAEITRRQRALVVGSKRGRKLCEPTEARPEHEVAEVMSDRCIVVTVGPGAPRAT